MSQTLLNFGKSTPARSQKDDDAQIGFSTQSAEARKPQPPPAEIWQAKQDALAKETELSILLVDGRQPPSLAVSNNNSICRVLQSSEKHTHLCEPFCGKAFDNVQKNGEAIAYLCHAGLQCVAAPLPPNPVRPLVTIVGRAFTKISDYQKLYERMQSGDLQDLHADELLKDLRFAGSVRELLKAAESLCDLNEEEKANLVEFIARTEPNPYNEAESLVEISDEREETAQNVKAFLSSNVHYLPDAYPSTKHLTFLDEETLEKPVVELPQIEKADAAAETANDTLEDFKAWQLFTDVLLDKSFKDACAETVRFLSARYGFVSMAWLERSHHLFRLFLAADDLKDKLSGFGLSADDAHLQEAVLNETSWRLKKPQIEIFPLAVGDDVRAAIVIGEEITDNSRRRRVARFCNQIAVSLEVLRLREELARRAEIVRAVQMFSEKLNSAEHLSEGSSLNLFDALMRTCAELLQAERGSLLLFDEAEQRLAVKAAFGTRAEEVKKMTAAVGELVAERVWREGKPVVVENVANINQPPAPAERGYRSKSFISYPLYVGSRVIGVLNVTDKRDEASYDARDLELLEAIAPQMAIALDRATLQQRAGIFEQLSITDSLTGLLNRRYLNERLQEEVNRSNRDGSPMSFMMIDIDNFKLYNDRFGHQAGDEVLKITAQCLKAVLRSADVAARFGGEEFCLLLPNTTLSEARMIGERIRTYIEDTEFPFRTVTVSIGVSAYSPLHNSPQEIIEAADKALYQAKRMGKNNVQLWLFGQSRR